MYLPAQVYYIELGENTGWGYICMEVDMYSFPVVFCQVIDAISHMRRAL